MIRHEFEWHGKDHTAKSLKCIHCNKLFVYCVNKDGSYNTKCVKRRNTP